MLAAEVVLYVSLCLLSCRCTVLVDAYLLDDTRRIPIMIPSVFPRSCAGTELEAGYVCTVADQLVRIEPVMLHNLHYTLGCRTYTYILPCLLLQS